MERIIPLSQIKNAVDAAFEKFNGVSEGSVDPRVAGADASSFAIAVCLADGTIISKGDVDRKSPLGDIVKIPVSSVLLSQNPVEELIRKSGGCCCGCKGQKPQIPVSRHGVRAVSAIEPVGDPDSKWNILVDRMINMMGSAPELDDKLYESLQAENQKADTENKLAEAGYYLFDDAPASIQLYTRGVAMTASARQLAIMGATIAADGVNPLTEQIVYDGAISSRIVAMMAVKGPHKMSRPWLVASGLPAKSSFGGAIVGVIPGVMSIAAYSPLVNEKGVSVKGAKALIDITNSLQINVFGSAKIVVDKEK